MKTSFFIFSLPYCKRERDVFTLEIAKMMMILGREREEQGTL